MKKKKNELRSLEEYQSNAKFNSFRGSVPGVAEGWCTRKDAAEYQRLVSQVHNGQIIEIGAYEGLSLFQIKDICKANNTTLRCVDFIAWPKLIENCQTWDIEFINKPSLEATKDFPDEFFDLIYIDADHQTPECTWDIWTWLPKLKKTGTLCGHDYDHQSVRRALHHVFGRLDVFELGGNVWSIKEPHDKVARWPKD